MKPERDDTETCLLDLTAEDVMLDLDPGWVHMTRTGALDEDDPS